MKKLNESVKKKKSVNKIIKDFLKRSRELELQEKNFRLKVLRSTNK